MDFRENKNKYKKRDPAARRSDDIYIRFFFFK